MNGATGAGALVAEGMTWGCHWGSPWILSLSLSVSSSESLGPSCSLSPSNAHTDTLSELAEDCHGNPPAKLSKHLLTIIPDDVLILSEAEAVGRVLKSSALCVGPAGDEGGGSSRR